jgi:hypothetical protein
VTSRVDVLLDTARAGRDPFDFFPWSWEPYLDDRGRAQNLGSIATPNGPGHTYWQVVEIEGQLGELICQLVNLAAAERYGTAVPGARRPC